MSLATYHKFHLSNHLDTFGGSKIMTATLLYSCCLRGLLRNRCNIERISSCYTGTKDLHIAWIAHRILKNEPRDLSQVSSVQPLGYIRRLKNHDCNSSV